jgi:5,5'-dehydrodivanillate O-demethylase oxygenase subunit
LAKTAEQNDRLTRVGPGTPMGELMRRYWHPVGATLQLDENPVRKVRLLGEDLTLFRSESGEIGLVGERCPHRCMEMSFGVPDKRGLRCGYHAWLFDAQGNCLEQPWEDRIQPELRFRDKIKIKAYPVQELGGLIFAYLGPQPAPLLPRWDLLVLDDVDRGLDIQPIPCNWLQCMDNSFDPLHFEFLHAGFGNYQFKRLGLPPGMTPAKHVDIAFDVFEYGVYKRRLLEGQSLESADWTIGHPVIFPALLSIGDNKRSGLHWRVPTDDTHTTQFLYSTRTRQPGEAAKPMAVATEVLFNENRELVDNIDRTIKQDIVAWVAQGAISDRTQEHLSPGDKGIILYHKMLNENIDRVARGEDPMGTIRDAAKNTPLIPIKRSREHDQAFQIRDGMEPTLWQNAEAGAAG